MNSTISSLTLIFSSFRTYYHMMKFGKLTESTALTLLEYIQRNLPEGVAMKVTKFERQKFPHVIDEHINEITKL